jgi:hypothetical protein
MTSRSEIQVIINGVQTTAELQALVTALKATVKAHRLRTRAWNWTLTPRKGKGGAS